MGACAHAMIGMAPALPACRRAARASLPTASGVEMTAMMKAAVVREFGAPLTIDEVPVPQPGRGQIQATVSTAPLEKINEIFTRMRAGDIERRVVMEFAA